MFFFYRYELQTSYDWAWEVMPPNHRELPSPILTLIFVSLASAHCWDFP